MSGVVKIGSDPSRLELYHFGFNSKSCPRVCNWTLKLQAERNQNCRNSPTIVVYSTSKANDFGVVGGKASRKKQNLTTPEWRLLLQRCDLSVAFALPFQGTKIVTLSWLRIPLMEQKLSPLERSVFSRFMAGVCVIILLQRCDPSRSPSKEQKLSPLFWLVNTWVEYGLCLMEQKLSPFGGTALLNGVLWHKSVCIRKVDFGTPWGGGFFSVTRCVTHKHLEIYVFFPLFCSFLPNIKFVGWEWSGKEGVVMV